MLLVPEHRHVCGHPYGDVVVLPARRDGLDLRVEVYRLLLLLSVSNKKRGEGGNDE